MCSSLSRLTATRPLVQSPREPSIKGNTPMQDKELTSQPLRITHGGSSDIALKEESRGCFTVPIAGRKGRWGQDFSSDIPAAPVQGKGLGPDQRGGALGSCGRIVLITYREGGQDNCIQGTVPASTAEPSGTNWQPHGDKECFSGRERALPLQVSEFQTCSVRV